MMSRISTTTDGQGNAAFCTAAGQPIQLRGINYIQLDVGGNNFHNLFDLGKYNPAAVRHDLMRIAAWSWDYVRIFLGTNYFNGPEMVRLPEDKAWLPNLLDFLAACREQGLRVVITGQDMPPWAYITKEPTQNSKLLDSSFMVDSLLPFWVDLMTELTIANALDVVLAYDVANEMFVDATAPPFAGDELGQDNDARQSFLDSAAIGWLSKVRNTIRAADPAALVSASAYPPTSADLAVYNGVRNCIHYPLRPKALAQVADYIDIHLYLASAPKAGMVAAEQGPIDNWWLDKPLMIGEIGVPKQPPYNSPQRASNALLNLMRWTTHFGASAWGIWRWQHDTAFWSPTDGNGIMNYTLSPGALPEL